MNQSKRYPWIVVGLLWVVALLNYMDRQMISTMKPAMQIDIAELQSATNFGRLMAIFLWVYGLMSPFAGMIADKVNRKWLIVISLFVWSAVTFSMGYATTYNQLYWLRALMGVSEALYIPAGLAMIADYHSDKTRSLAVGLHLSGLYVGQALGGFGATIADKFSWSATFHSFGFIGMGYAFILIFFLQEKKGVYAEMPTKDAPLVKRTSPFKGVAVLLSNFSFWIMIFYFAIPSLPGWGIKNWLPTLFAQNLNIGMGTAGPISTITISVSSLIGVLVGGKLSDKWAQTNIKGRVYTSAIGLGLTIPALLLIGFGHSMFHVIGSAFCFGFGFGMFDTNNMPLLCQIVPAKYRATAYGLLNMAGIMAGAFITDLLGKSSDSGKLGNGFAIMAAVVFIALLLQLFLFKPKPSTSLE